MKWNTTPRRTDTGINFSTWENTVRQVKKLMNIKFDPTLFFVQDNPSGMYITMAPSSGGANDSTWAFECTQKENNAASSTWTIEVSKGHFQVQGYDDFVLDKAVYNLPNPSSASNCYATVVFNISSEVLELKMLPAYPTMTASDISVPLTAWISNATSMTWTEDDPHIYHKGNVDQIATSIVFG
jgi:hypothetical protein